MAAVVATSFAAVGLVARRFGLGERGDGLEREVRMHRARAVRDQERDMRHLSRFARFRDETYAPAQTFADEMVVDGRDRERRRNRRVVLVDAAIAEDEHAAAGATASDALRHSSSTARSSAQPRCVADSPA